MSADHELLINCLRTMDSTTATAKYLGWVKLGGHACRKN